MKHLIKVSFIQGDGDGNIETLIKFLQSAQTKGATTYEFVWSGDPMWDFKWLNTYKHKSKEEILEEEIAMTEKNLNYLKTKREQ